MVGNLHRNVAILKMSRFFQVSNVNGAYWEVSDGENTGLLILLGNMFRNEFDVNHGICGIWKQSRIVFLETHFYNLILQIMVWGVFQLSLSLNSDHTLPLVYFAVFDSQVTKAFQQAVEGNMFARWMQMWLTFYYKQNLSAIGSPS